MVFCCLLRFKCILENSPTLNIPKRNVFVTLSETESSFIVRRRSSAFLVPENPVAPPRTNFTVES